MKQKKPSLRRPRRTKISGKHLFEMTSFATLTLGALGWLFGSYVFDGRAGWGNAALNTEFWSLKIHGAGVMLVLVALGMSVEPMRKAWREAERSQKAMLALAGVLVGLLILTGWLIYYGPTTSIQDLVILAHWVLGLVALLAFGFWFWVMRPER
jgi:hypothetical protein